MTMSKLIRLVTLCAALVGTAAALPAQVTLSITFSPVLESGADPEGFASSTWTMSFALPETYGGGAASTTVARVATGTLTIAGSASRDGTYTITGQVGDFGFFPNIGGALLFAYTPSIDDNTFSFAGVTVSDFAADGPNITNTRPPVGSPVSVDHFHGATISSTTDARGINSFAVNNGSDISRYTFSNITLTAVPETGTYAAIVGLFALGLTATRRRSRRPIPGSLVESGDRFRRGEGDVAPPGPPMPQTPLPPRHPSTFRLP